MPVYVWKARDRKGAGVTGQLNARSRDAVITALRRQNLMVVSVEEAALGAPVVTHAGPTTVPALPVARGSSASGLVAAIMIGVALWLGSRAPVNFVRCTSDRQCAIERSFAGVYPMSREPLANVTGAAVEPETNENVIWHYLSADIATSAVALRGPGGRIATDPMPVPLPTSDDELQLGLRRYLQSPSGEFSAWQIDVVWNALAVLLLLMGLSRVRQVLQARRAESQQIM